MDGQTVLGEYTYNAKGQRVKKVASSTIIYHYDIMGNLIQETDGSGNVIASYVYAGNMRLAKIESGGAIYYYHNDHLGTPLAMTDSSGSVVWKAAYNPFGKAEVDPSSTVTNNFRFPGQYYDAESGLHYNWHRYYDPGTGRYMTADLIGLRGGINLYLYSMNNPLVLFDQMGLSCTSSNDCLTCMIYAEAGGTNSTCKTAVAWTIKNRTKDPIHFPGQTDCCKVVSSPGQFDSYGNSRWNSCCNDCLKGPEKSSKDQVDNIVQNLGNDITNGATFFIDISIITPIWIQIRIEKGLMEEVIVPGCNDFKFFKIN
jgi:RHS repeat-associated protein